MLYRIPLAAVNYNLFDVTITYVQTSRHKLSTECTITFLTLGFHFLLNKHLLHVMQSPGANIVLKQVFLPVTILVVHSDY